MELGRIWKEAAVICICPKKLTKTSGCIADPVPGFEAIDIEIKSEAKEFAQKHLVEIFTALGLVLYVGAFLAT